jgi:hypothetical protein
MLNPPGKFVDRADVYLCGPDIAEEKNYALLVDGSVDLPRKIYPSKMRVERPKKERISHEPTKTRTDRPTLAQSR